jgi:hypothetical protein
MATDEVPLEFNTKHQGIDGNGSFLQFGIVAPAI